MSHTLLVTAVAGVLSLTPRRAIVMRKDPSSPRARTRRPTGCLTPAPRTGLTGTVATLFFLTVPGVAWADEMESDEAAVLVEQAIALIANDAGEARVAERIEDALEAPRKEGVDLALVSRALDVVERPGQDGAAPSETRELLVQTVPVALVDDTGPSADRPRMGGQQRLAVGGRDGGMQHDL